MVFPLGTSNLQIKRGFTLVELLIVLSIIALLLALIMPAFGLARSYALRIVCQAYLHQWGIAFGEYALGNNDFYPHIDSRDRSKDLADEFGWVQVIPPIIKERPFYDYPYGQRPDVGTFFQCPAARLAPLSSYGYPIVRDGFFSYAMNSCLELDMNCYEPDDIPGGNNMPPFLQTTLICHPSRVIMLFDQLLDPSLGYNGKLVNDSAGEHCGSYPKDFSARHARPGSILGGSILYCDYHVEWRDTVWKSHWPDDLKAPPRNDRDWYPYP